MNSTYRTLLAAAVLAGAAFSIPAAVAGELPPRQRQLIQAMKQVAETRPGMINRTPQGAFYFKWLSAAPPGYDKAYFKLGELAKGDRFLSLQLIANKPGSVELTVLLDQEGNGSIDEVYQSAARSLAEADRVISTAPEKCKAALSAERSSTYRIMLDQLKWDLENQAPKRPRE